MILNLFVVWFLTGIWHGASWNFILWGLYFGLLIYLEKKFLLKLLNKVPKIFSHIYLIILVIVGWTIFYFTDITKVFEYLGILFGFSNNEFTNMEINLVITNNIFWILISVIASTPVVPFVRKLVDETNKTHIAQFLNMFVNVAIIVLCTAMLIDNSYNPFLYFRF